MMHLSIYIYFFSYSILTSVANKSLSSNVYFDTNLLNCQITISNNTANSVCSFELQHSLNYLSYRISNIQTHI